jgi:hypothetical protein
MGENRVWRVYKFIAVRRYYLKIGGFKFLVQQVK